MEAKLIKDHDNYHLVNDKQFVIGTTDKGILSCTDKIKLSIKNCQAIELGYDLENMADFLKCKHDWHPPDDLNLIIDVYKQGFQKALEILGDKKFSEEDIKEAYLSGVDDAMDIKYDPNATIDDEKHLKSLQQTEWDCIIEMDICGDKVYAVPEPKLDSDNCIILKRK